MFHQVCLQLFPKRVFRDVTVLLSSRPLEEKFMKSLKEIKNFNNAFHFCGLVCKAKETIEPVKKKQMPNPLLKSSENHDKLIHELKTIIHKAKSEYILIEPLLMVVQNTTDNSDKVSDLLSLLTNINKSEILNQKYKNSGEFLKDLIKCTEHLIASFSPESTYFKLHHGDFLNKNHYFYSFDRNFMESLDALQITLFYSTIAKANCLLRVIFQIEGVNLDFSKEEKKEIDTSMIEALSPIESCIHYATFRSGCNLHSGILQKRSSLQFLIEDFPKNGILLDNFYIVKIKESIKTLDAFITQCCDYWGDHTLIKEDQDECYVDNWEGEAVLAKAVAFRMPKSHTWWGQSVLKVLNKRHIM